MRRTTQLVGLKQVGILERFVFGATRFSVPLFGEFCFGWSAEMSEKQDCGRAGECQYSGNYGYWRAFLDGDVIQNSARGAGGLRSDAKTGSANKSSDARRSSRLDWPASSDSMDVF
jgi:hypothetical protein